MNRSSSFWGLPAAALLVCLSGLTACDTPPPPANLVSGPAQADQALIRLELERPGDVLSFLRVGFQGVGVRLDTGTILTAAHVVRAIDRDDSRNRVRFRPLAEPDTLIRADTLYFRPYLERDIASIHTLPGIETPRVMRVASRFPGQGAEVTAVLVSDHRGPGYVRRQRSTVLGTSWNGLIFAIEGTTVPGDSGGPVLNDKGELIGLVIGGPAFKYHTISFPFVYQPGDPDGGFAIYPVNPNSDDTFTGSYIICANVVPDLD